MKLMARDTRGSFACLAAALSFGAQLLLPCAEAQPMAPIPIVAFIEGSTAPRSCNEPTMGIQAFKEKLQNLGYVIGQTVVVERRCYEQLKGLLEASGRKADIMISVTSDADMAGSGPWPPGSFGVAIRLAARW